MRAADLATAAALALLGLVVIVDAVRLGFGWGGDGPRSGFFPFWLATLLVATCLLILLQAWRRRAAGPFLRPGQLRPVLTVLVPAAVFVALTQMIGLYVSAALYIAYSMRWVGQHSTRAVAALAIGIPVLTFLIFEKWFLVPMPKGPLEHWLGY